MAEETETPVVGERKVKDPAEEAAAEQAAKTVEEKERLRHDQEIAEDNLKRQVRLGVVPAETT